jgi:hypothetical protein
MTHVLYPPARAQSVGEILDTAFRIFRLTLLRCLPYAILAVIAGQLPNIYTLLRGGELLQALTAPRHDSVWWLLYVIGAVLALLLWSATLLRQYAMATGHPVSAATELSTCLQRLLPLIGLLLLMSAAIVVWFAPVALLSGPARLLAEALALVPATYLGVALSCGWPALLLTGSGPLASLSHSWRLTSGSWWRLSLIYTVAVVLVVVLYVLSGIVAGVIAALAAHGDLAMVTASTAALVIILSSIGTPFYCALMLAVFGDLSVRREGVDLAQRIAAAGTP